MHIKLKHLLYIGSFIHIYKVETFIVQWLIHSHI